MDLILWRHAEAEVLAPGGSDSERTLTKRGQRHAARMAQWLDAHLPDTIRVLSSPALRCTQTADALGRNYKPRGSLVHHRLDKQTFDHISLNVRCFDDCA